MKMVIRLRILAIVLFALIIGNNLTSAQSLVYFQGDVTEINSGDPIPNHLVTLIGSNSSIVISITNELGEYLSAIEINTPQSSFVVSTLDCENISHSVFFDLVDSVNIANFSICNNLPGCDADFFFEINPANPLEVSFFDNSEGNISFWLWYFSDGFTSFEQNPVHEFASPGSYLVSLTVSDSTGFCYDTISKIVYLPEDSIVCHAAFSYQLDTLNNTPNVYHFFNQSEGSPDTFFWDFGDGNFSSEENPMHTYNESGNYTVCLIISNLNNPAGCTDQVCDSLATLEYYNFGGQVFIGDFTINIEENDSSNMAVANLYRRIENKWEFMDQMSFWKYGYYWFLNKPAGEYLLRVDLQQNSIDYSNYAPSYHQQSISWENAVTFTLTNNDQFAVNIYLTELANIPAGIGSISGVLLNNGTCLAGINFGNILVQLFNSEMKIAAYTYSNGDGLFEFSNIVNGNYFVKAEFTGKSSELYSATLTENNNTISGVQLAIGCDSFIGIDRNFLENESDLVSVYPIPASEMLTIETDFTEYVPLVVELINLNGLTVFKKTILFNSDKQQFKISVNSFPAGFYILRMANFENEISINKKIVIGK